MQNLSLKFEYSRWKKNHQPIGGSTAKGRSFIGLGRDYTELSRDDDVISGVRHVSVGCRTDDISGHGVGLDEVEHPQGEGVETVERCGVQVPESGDKGGERGGVEVMPSWRSVSVS